MSVRWEPEEYLKEEKPDIKGLTETKLGGEIEVFSIGEGKYNMWRRNRTTKQRGGVMLLIKMDITVEEGIYGKGQAEVLQIRIKGKGERKRDLVVVYESPKTGA